MTTHKFHKKFSFERDYSPVKLEKYLKFAGITQSLDDESILINLGVAEKIDGILKMKNAGVLFFTESIQLLCEQATITCGVFLTVLRGFMCLTEKIIPRIS